jgi:hypothetical protein
MRVERSVERVVERERSSGRVLEADVSIRVASRDEHTSIGEPERQQRACS